MLKLIHAPMSRSSRILWLIEEMGIADKVDIQRVNIRRFDGSGARDPANPHPEGKVPVLFHTTADGTATVSDICPAASAALIAWVRRKCTISAVNRGSYASARLTTIRKRIATGRSNLRGSRPPTQVIGHEDC